MISKKEFFEKLNNLPKTIQSKTKKASYTSFKLTGKTLSFYRVNPKTNWDLDASQLYEIYCKEKFINTSIIKANANGRVNSPSIAVLMAIDCVDEDGYRKD